MSIRAAFPWLIIVAMCLACGGADRFTAENFAAIEGGMSPDEVQTLLGPPDKVNKYRGELQWYYRRGDVTGAVTFRGNRVIHKGETGLGVGDAEY
jgi:hypothetical protein